jgi:glycosyltransferase involved in cell wall biosynthesis
LVRSAEGQDILHLHWAHPYLLSSKLSLAIQNALAFFRFLLRQKARGKKLIWTIHNLGEHDKRHPRFERLCNRCLARLADGIIVHSRYAQGKTIEAYRLGRQADKVRVIPHGNYIGNYPCDVSREQARAEIGIDGEKKVFLFLGQIRPYKGLPELVSAFERTTTGHETLILAGKPLDDRIKAELEQLVAGRKDILCHPERIPDEKIQLYMNAADAVVFPFRDIFTSGSLLLAMSFGKPIVVPDLESLKDLTEYGGAITYDHGRSESLESALRRAASTDLTHLGARNLAAAQKLSWDTIAEKTAELYAETLRQHRESTFSCQD